MHRSDFQLMKLQLSIVFIGLLGLYSWTMPITLTLEDDGFFVMSAWFNGVSHPPGYPLHTIFTHLATLIPMGSIPARVHFVSSIFAALSALCLSLIIFNLLRSKFLAMFSGMLLGCSKIFWSQAIIAEVYTLNTFLYLMLVYISILIFKSENNLNRKKILYGWAAFVYGLAIANHWPLIVLGSSLLFILYFYDWRLIIRLFPKLILFFFIGLLPYAWMIYRSGQEPVFSFLGEIRSFSDFIYIFSRSSYASQDQSATADWYDKLQYLFWFSRLSLEQFFLPLSLIGFIGLAGSWVILSKQIAFALAAAFITQSYFLILLLGFDYEPEKQSIIGVYFLPAFAIFSIWIAIGVSISLNFFKNKFNINKKLLNFVFVILLSLQMIENLFHNDRSNDRFSYEYSTVVFDLLPKNSIFIVDDDISAGVFGYYHFVEGNRPDITLISSTGYAFNTRLFHPIGTHVSIKNQALSNLLLNSGRPVFATRSVQLFGKVPQINHGIVHELAPKLNSKLNFKFSAYVYQFYFNISTAIYYTDSWEKGFREYLMMKGIYWAMFYRNNIKVQESGYDMKALIEQLNQTPKTALVLYEFILLNVKENYYLNKIPDLKKYIEENIHALSKHEKSVFKRLKKKPQQLK